MMFSILLYGSLLGLMVLSAFFSGSETGFYRLSRFRLRVGVEQNQPFYPALFKLVREGQALIMSILIGNNLANYLLTSFVTVLMFRRLSDQRLAELYTTALLTPILFVFGEMIPKILFYHWADILIPRLTWLLWLAHKTFTLTGTVAALRWLSDRLTRLLRLGADTAAAVDATQRHQVFQIIHETREEGLLSHVQREMMERLLQIPNVPVQSVMTPFQTVEKVSVQTSRRQLLDHLAQTSFARQPVCAPDGTVVGYIPIYEVLGGEQDFSDLRLLVRPIVTLEPTCSAIDAMNILCRKQEKIALIQSPQTKQPLGIITLTDLVEELTGELAVA
jgi:CBS domain containing-hemolysin-like protein